MACEDLLLSVLDYSSHLIVEVVRDEWCLVLWARMQEVQDQSPLRISRRI